MKARIKKTGDIVNIEDYSMIFIDRKNEFGDTIHVRPDELEFIDEEKGDEIDWEQRRYEIARDILSARLVHNGYIDTSMAIKNADKLIEELKK